MPLPKQTDELNQTNLLDTLHGFLNDTLNSMDEQLALLKEDMDIFEKPKDEHENLCLRVRNSLRIIESAIVEIGAPNGLKKQLENISRKHRKLHNVIFTA